MVSTYLKNLSQNGNLLQIEVILSKYLSCHHLDFQGKKNSLLVSRRENHDVMPSKFQGTTGNRGGKVPAIGPGGTLRDEGIFFHGEISDSPRPALNVAGRG